MDVRRQLRVSFTAQSAQQILCRLGRWRLRHCRWRWRWLGLGRFARGRYWGRRRGSLHLRLQPLAVATPAVAIAPDDDVDDLPCIRQRVADDHCGVDRLHPDREVPGGVVDPVALSLESLRRAAYALFVRDREELLAARPSGGLTQGWRSQHTERDRKRPEKYGRHWGLATFCSLHLSPLIPACPYKAGMLHHAGRRRHEAHRRITRLKPPGLAHENAMHLESFSHSLQQKAVKVDPRKRRFAAVWLLKTQPSWLPALMSRIRNSFRIPRLVSSSHSASRYSQVT